MTMVGNLCTKSAAWDIAPLLGDDDGFLGSSQFRPLDDDELVLVLLEARNGYVKVLCGNECGYVWSKILVMLIEPKV